MTELSFTRVEKGLQSYYECDVTVESDFNLHIELAEARPLSMESSTVEGGAYHTIFEKTANIFDEDFAALVYPKHLHIRAWAEPTSAFVTEAGGSGSAQQLEEIDLVVAHALNDLNKRVAALEQANE